VFNDETNLRLKLVQLFNIKHPKITDKYCHIVALIRNKIVESDSRWISRTCLKVKIKVLETSLKFAAWRRNGYYHARR